jgi:hypothetical protein
MSAPPAHDRRRRRSSDPITALHYQLSLARHEGGFEALVLVDEIGALVAGAGAWPVCEELAAFAPLLAEPSRLAGSPIATDAAAFLEGVSLHSFVVDGAPVVLAARGPDADSGLLGRAASGCQRILCAAA